MDTSTEPRSSAGWKRAKIAVVFTLAVLAVSTGIAAASPDAPPSPNSAASQTQPQKAFAEADAGHLVRIDAPCRVFDTRKKNAPIQADTVRNVKVGGKCGVPPSASGLIASVTVIGPAASGYLTGYAADTSRPNTRIASFAQGQPTTAGATLPLRVGTGANLSIYSSAQTHVIIDVTGYYEQQIHAVMSPSGGIYVGGPRVLTSERLNTGYYRVTIDRDPAGCTPIASINGNAYFATSYVSGGFIYANTYTPEGTLADLFWSLTVVC